MVTKQTVFDFIKKENMCVLSTASKDGKVESAVMAYTFDENNLVFIFSTMPQSRKNKNILENNSASLVVGGFKNDPSVQIDGSIKNLEGDEYQKAKDYVFTNHPTLKEYITPEHKFFEFKPTWMRYLDYSLEQPETEFTNL